MANPTSTEDSSFRHDRRPNHEAQGQAALLLLEALIHGLLDKGVVDKDDIAEAIRSAIEVKEESATQDKESREVLDASVALLRAMANSIRAHSGRYDPDRGSS